MKYYYPRYGTLRRIGNILLCCGVLLLGRCRCSEPSPEWSRTLSTTGSGAVHDVIAAGPGFVAVGRLDDVGAVWTSADGETWEVHTDDFPQPSTLYAVTTYEGGLIAAGTGIWISADGAAWMQVDTVSSGTVYFDVAATPGQVLVAGIRSIDGLENGAVWRSSDPGLLNWSNVYTEPGEPLSQNPSTLAGSAMSAVVAAPESITEAGGPAFIAVGRKDKWVSVIGSWNDDSDAAIWKSANGSDWTLQSVSDPVFAADHSTYASRGSQRLTDVMVQGTAIYVSGYDLHADDGTGSQIWRSIDNGSTWIRLSDNRPENLPAFDQKHSVQALRNLAPTNTFRYGELAVGEIGVYSEADCGVWRGATGYPRWHRFTDTQLAGPGRQVCNAGSGSDDVMVVAGSDGSSPAIWTLARP